MATSCENIMNKPWPHHEQTLRLDQMEDLPLEEKERLRDENAYLSEENAQRRQAALNEKRYSSSRLHAPTALMYLVY